MDLQYRRNLEQFFSLLGYGPIRLSERLEYRCPPFGIMMEYKLARVLMTSWCIAPSELKPEQVALIRWRLERFEGIPQRLLMVKGHLMVTMALPVASGAHDWYRLCLEQRKLLTKNLEITS